MGYYKSVDPQTIRTTYTPEQQSLFDMFYDGDKCKLDGLSIAEYQGGNGIKQGIRINGDIAQVDFLFDDKRIVTVTFDANNPESMNKSLTVIPGDGGIEGFGVADNYGLGKLNNYYLDGNADYTTFTFADPYNNEQNNGPSWADKAIPQIENIISNGNPNFRHIVAGASQGSINTVNVAGEIFASYGDGEKKPIDIMLLDAKSDTNNNQTPCEPFVDYLLKRSDVKQDLIETGSVIYAYEGQDNKITKTPEQAIPALKKAAAEGLHVLMIVDPNLKGHAGQDSPDMNITNGEVEKIFAGFKMDSSLKEMSSDKYKNTYYIIDPDEIDGYKKDAEGNAITLSDDQVSRYLESNREEVRKNFNGLSTLDHIELKETPFKDVSAVSKIENRRTSINYESVIKNTNFVVDSINKTAFVNNDFDYQYCDSTTSFPESLNEANAYLFSTSGDLLKVMANDTKNIEQMLNNNAYLDRHLAMEAEYLNPENNYGFYSGLDINVNRAQSINDRTQMISIFGENLTQGNAGKINLYDLESMYNGMELRGPIGEGLKNEIEDATDLKMKIENLIEDTDIEDPAWNIMVDRLMQYEHCCDLRVAAAEILNESYVKSLKHVIDYMYPYKNLDDSKIPEYTTRINNAIAKIAQLESANAFLAGIQPTPIYGYTKTGVPVFYGYDYSAYNAAQNQIKVNNNTIEELVIQLEEDNKVLEKLNGLADALIEANKIVDDAILEVDKLYTSEVSTIDPVFVTPLGEGGLL